MTDEAGEKAPDKLGSLKTVGLAALVAAGSAFGTIEAVIGPRIRDAVRQERVAAMTEMQNTLNERLGLVTGSFDGRIIANRESIQTSLATHDHNGEYLIRKDLMPVLTKHLTEEHVSPRDLALNGARIDRLSARVNRLEDKGDK